jgi:heme/copper-type cytochrome/quinol oxidase subunit 2
LSTNGVTREKTIIAVLVIVAIVVSGLFGFYLSTIAKSSSGNSQPQATVVNLDVVPDYGGATYDAFVLPSSLLNGFVPIAATNTTGPGPNDNNITVSANTPVKFVLTSLDNAINENFSAQVSTPFNVYNDTASGQALSTYNVGQSISNMSIGHTFTIAQMGVNIPIPPTTVVSFTLTFTKPGLYLYVCDTPCGPGMGLLGYMEGYIIVTS